jgi:enoyl-CoA hydratase/carnithine racemase
VFALPEVKRGVAPIGGALPRLMRTVGLQRATQFALLGEPISARTACEWGLVNKVVQKEEVVAEAVRYAAAMAENSPDAIICARAGLRQAWETAAVERAVELTLDGEWADLQKGENIKEGLQAFSEKRKPVWKGSRL